MRTVPSLCNSPKNITSQWALRPFIFSSPFSSRSQTVVRSYRGCRCRLLCHLFPILQALSATFLIKNTNICSYFTHLYILNMTNICLFFNPAFLHSMKRSLCLPNQTAVSHTAGHPLLPYAPILFCLTSRLLHREGSLCLPHIVHRRFSSSFSPAIARAFIHRIKSFPIAYFFPSILLTFSSFSCYNKNV